MKKFVLLTPAVGSTAPLCHCGKPLHYSNLITQEVVQDLVNRLGEYMTVEVEGRRWRVQRHYVALHGLKASELPKLGFEELTPPEGVDKKENS